MTAQKLWIYWGITLGVITVLTIVILEVSANVLGFTPWQPEEKNIQIDPPGGFFQKDKVIGFSLKPGHFELTLEDSLSFSCTNTDAGHRVTHNPDQFVLSEPEKTIWILGGSYTYGWSVNDTESYPYLLQREFPQYQVVNFGVPGFGTLQSYLQFKEALDNNCAPDIVILAYAGFHDMRNVGSRMWYKTLAPFNKLGPLDQPVARFVDTTLQLYYEPLNYQPWKYQDKLAIAHAWEQYRNKVELRKLRANEVSTALVDSFYKITQACMSRFVVAPIITDERSEKLVHYCLNEACIPVWDISLNTELPGMTNKPYDSHPSTKGQAWYAEKLAGFVRSETE